MLGSDRTDCLDTHLLIFSILHIAFTSHILSGNEKGSEKFWKLKERIDTDAKKKGVIIEMKRSILVNNLISLIDEAVIDIEDLNEFSDELKEKVLSPINILNRTRKL